MNRATEKISEFWFTIVFVLIVFQSILTSWVSDVFSYSDEIFALLGLVNLIRYKFDFLQKYQQAYVHKWMITLVLILFIGVISSVNSHLQPIGIIWINEILTFMKMFSVFIYCLYVLRRCSVSSVCRKLGSVLTIYLLLCVIFCFLNQLLVFDPLYDEYRFGIRDYRFFHSNAGEFSTIMIVVIAFLHVKSVYFKKLDKLLISFAFICLLATTRGKAFGVGAAYIGILLFLKNKSKLTMISVVKISVLAIIFGWFQLEKYFLGEESTPRSVLLLFGFLTANTYFPLGAGFGAYGSNMARLHYSSLYTKYGFENMYGMGDNPEDISFLNDNFWPMVMGQYGWLGVILYIYIIYCIFKLVYKLKVRQLQISGYLLFFTIVSSSTGGSTILHYLGSAIMVVYALTISASNQLPSKIEVK